VLATIEVRAFGRRRLSQLRSSLLVGLTRGIFKYNDRLCCVGGLPNSNTLDTMMVVDVEREFRSLVSREADILPGGVKIEVIERVLSIATELAVEGREGHAIGCLFVIGDAGKVNGMVKPLLLNPFYGYKEEDRNILNPFMDETIKELSSVDGAFIISGQGVIESAGSLLHAPAEYYHSLPSGLGSRHAAAAAMSLAADCVAIVVSSSTGQVTLFRRGVMLPVYEKNLETGF
jgi:DNA integrity scanning protein DisA with diadenylate cyclase activity